jgi:hypothetical protein
MGVITFEEHFATPNSSKGDGGNFTPDFAAQLPTASVVSRISLFLKFQHSAVSAGTLLCRLPLSICTEGYRIPCRGRLERGCPQRGGGDNAEKPLNH